MPTVTLKFNLPDEQEDFQSAVKGGEYRLAMSEFDDYLRKRLKYETLDEPVYQALQAARDQLRHQLEIFDLLI